MRLKILQQFLERKTREEDAIVDWNKYIFSIYELEFLSRSNPVESIKLKYILDILIEKCDSNFRGLLEYELNWILSRHINLQNETEGFLMPDDKVYGSYVEIVNITKANFIRNISDIIVDFTAYLVDNYHKLFSIRLNSPDIDYTEFREKMISDEYESCARIVKDWMTRNKIKEINSPNSEAYNINYPSIRLDQVERYIEKTQDLDEHYSLGLITEIERIRMKHYFLDIGFSIKIFPFIVFNYIPLEITKDR